MRIRNREFVRDVKGTVSFQSLIFKLQVADQITFPWLSQIARSFEEWVPKSIRFEFRSLASATSGVNTTALGSVVMATDYNSYNPPFVGKSEMENYAGAQSCKPSVSMKHYIKTGAHRNPLGSYYTNDAEGYPQGADIRMYDIGNFQFATVGQPNVTSGATTDPIVLPLDGTGVIGELWVSYDIEFRKPKTRGTSLQSNIAHWKHQDRDNTAGALFGLDEGLLGEPITHWPSYASSWPNNGANMPFIVSGDVLTGTTYEKGEKQKLYFPIGSEKDECYLLQLITQTPAAATIDFSGLAATWTLGSNVKELNYLALESSEFQGSDGFQASACDVTTTVLVKCYMFLQLIGNVTKENQSESYARMLGEAGNAEPLIDTGRYDLMLFQLNTSARSAKSAINFGVLPILPT